MFDSLFGLGRLQPLVDDDAIETIEVRGHDRVTLVNAGGVIVDGPPVADTDEEFLEQLHHLASRAGPTGRPFSETDPSWICGCMVAIGSRRRREPPRARRTW